MSGVSAAVSPSRKLCEPPRALVSAQEFASTPFLPHNGNDLPALHVQFEGCDNDESRNSRTLEQLGTSGTRAKLSVTSFVSDAKRTSLTSMGSALQSSSELKSRRVQEFKDIHTLHWFCGGFSLKNPVRAWCIAIRKTWQCQAFFFGCGLYQRREHMSCPLCREEFLPGEGGVFCRRSLFSVGLG